MSSKSGALLALLACALLTAMTTAQDTETPWFWIMADSKNAGLVCPGRCLAVNDTNSPGAYINRPVGFVACKTVDTSSTSGYVSSSFNNNQQWLREPHEKTLIQINATGSTDSQTPPQLLCLQPDLRNAQRSLVVTTCSDQEHQKWIVANNTISSLAFDPPRYLAMTHRLSGFLDPTDGTTAWRDARIITTQAGDSSLTTTFSMVDGTHGINPPPPLPDNAQPQSHNFIHNGGFEQTSADFSPSMTNLTLTESDIFGLCEWEIMKTEANIQGGSDWVASEGNRSLYLKDGIVKQRVATTPGAIYTLVLKAHVAPLSQSDSFPSGTGDGTDSCKGSDSLSVKPYPSTNVSMNVDVGNSSWSTKHVSFQALGPYMELSLKGCATCGCFIDDVNLMQVIDHAPFPPPPPMPSPPWRLEKQPHDHEPYGKEPGFDFHRPLSSKRLSNWAVVGLVVGAAALFFMIGAAFFGVVCVKEKKKSEMEMSRPREWSIQTTTPAQSERGRRSHQVSSNAPTMAPSSAPQPPSPHTSSTVGTTKYSTSQSSTNPQSGNGV